MGRRGRRRQDALRSSPPFRCAATGNSVDVRLVQRRTASGSPSRRGKSARCGNPAQCPEWNPAVTSGRMHATPAVGSMGDQLRRGRTSEATPQALRETVRPRQLCPGARNRHRAAGTCRANALAPDADPVRRHIELIVQAARLHRRLGSAVSHGSQRPAAQRCPNLPRQPGSQVCAARRGRAVGGHRGRQCCAEPDTHRRSHLPWPPGSVFSLVAPILHCPTTGTNGTADWSATGLPPCAIRATPP